MESFNVDKWHRLQYQQYFEVRASEVENYFGNQLKKFYKISYFNSKNRLRNQIKSDDWLESKTERVLISLFPKQPIGGRQEQKFLKSSYHGTIITLDWTYEILTLTVFWRREHEIERVCSWWTWNSKFLQPRVEWFKILFGRRNRQKPRQRILNHLLLITFKLDI